jgi:hypothetical protein
VFKKLMCLEVDVATLYLRPQRAVPLTQLASGLRRLGCV